MKTSSKKIFSLQALRALAFVAIFVSHANGLFIDLGAWGVSIFIILSGFCMMLAYKDREMPMKLRDRAIFSMKKMEKLYPLHIIMLVVVLCFIGISGWNTIKDFILDVLLVQAWVPDAVFSINGVAWYLSLSIFLYFVFPLIRKRIIKEKDRKNLIWTAAAIFILQVWVGYAANMLSGVDIKWLTYTWPLFRLGDFAIGCIVGYLFSTRKTKKEISVLKATIVEVIVFFILAGIEYLLLHDQKPMTDVWCRYGLIYTPFSVLLIYLFAIKRGLVTKILTNKLAVFIGNISGYAFLIHTVVLYNISPILFSGIEGMPRKVSALLAFVLTIVISVIYMKFDTAIRKYLKKKKVKKN